MCKNVSTDLRYKYNFCMIPIRDVEAAMCCDSPQTVQSLTMWTEHANFAFRLCDTSVMFVHVFIICHHFPWNGSFISCM